MNKSFAKALQDIMMLEEQYAPKRESVELGESASRETETAKKIAKKGKKLGDWVGKSYYEYEGNLWVLGGYGSDAVNRGPINKAKKTLNKSLLKKLKFNESVDELDEAIKVRWSGLGQVTKILKKKGIGFHTSKGNIMVNPKNLIAAKSALNKEFGGDFEKKTGMKLKAIKKVGISDEVEHLDEGTPAYRKAMAAYKNSDTKKVFDILKKKGFRGGPQGDVLVRNMLKKNNGNIQKAAAEIEKKYPNLFKESVELDEARKDVYSVVDITGKVVAAKLTRDNARKEALNMGGHKTIVLDPDAEVDDVLNKFAKKKNQLN